MDKRFVLTLEKRDLDPLFYKDIFEGCTSYKKLIGDDYHIGMSLHEMGLMAIKIVPVHNNDGRYRGVEVFFKSMIESEEKINNNTH